MNKDNQQKPLTTGLPGLDVVLEEIRAGDNVVFQVDSIDEYIRFVHPFCRAAQRDKRDLIYFRFASHQSLLPNDINAMVYKLHPEDGFENFISEIFNVIEKFGYGAFYVFDCLSELAVDWYSDRMLGNFFMLTCPYLYDYKTVTYFMLLRNNHTAFAVEAIHNTAQIVIDIYRNKNEFYVHPLIVDGRYSSTMYMLHRWERENFTPVTQSTVTAEILSAIPQPWLDLNMQQRDVWTKTFSQAQEIVNSTPPDKRSAWKSSKLYQKLLRMAVTREPRLLKLAEKYLDFGDVVEIGKRMIGTGLIGGKSAGMLLSRAILKKTDPEWNNILEPHDSFFIGSDVYYTYLIKNKCWWSRRKLKSDLSNHELADEARRLMRSGEFPKDIQVQFMEMLGYFGQSPIIVRSSSLLEDAYGNAFSGKYESVFCANQGTPQERLENFMDAVRTVYASTLSKEALAYRAHWGLLDMDEQMALLVQRVSGAVYKDHYYPQVAGVGFSFNPYVWNSEIDPKSGFLRLVFGLGTRAVDSIDDDYTRIVALNTPLRRPDLATDDIHKYTQHKVDILDLKENCHTTHTFEDISRESPDLPISIFASRDTKMERMARQQGVSKIFSWMLTFDNLLSQTTFVKNMRSMLETLQDAYQHPVDIEFTSNFINNDDYRINLVQCRPFQVKGNIRNIEMPSSIARDNIILETKGPVIGSSLATTVDRIIYIIPEIYSHMKISDRYSVARIIGRLTHLEPRSETYTILLIGPGRWATSSPELGVPVSFTEINTVSILCELAAMREGLVPEVSLGTHFFNDLVEIDMLYLAVHPQKYDNIFNEEFFNKSTNLFAELLPDVSDFSKVIKVVDSPKDKNTPRIYFNANAPKQNAMCYLSTGISENKTKELQGQDTNPSN